MGRVSRTAIVMGASLSLAAMSPVAREQSTIASALDRYAASDYDAAVAVVTATDFKLSRFLHDLDVWIQAGAAPPERRPLIAAGFAIEVVWRGSHQPSGGDRRMALRAGSFSGMVAPVVSWSCRQIRALPPSAALRSWFLASIAVLEDARGYAALISGTPPPGEPVPDDDLREGHLTHARRLFPDEGRITLAWLWVQDKLLSKEPDAAEMPASGIRRDEITADVRAAIASLQGGGNGASWLDSPRRRAALAIEKIPDIERVALAAARDPSIQPEGTLRLAHLQIRALRWEPALTALEPVFGSTTDSFLLYIGHYLAGWANVRLGRTEAAIAELQKAEALVSGVRGTVTLLAEQLFEKGRREEAYALVERVNRQSPARDDPWDDFKNGDVRLIPLYLEQLREALQ